MSTMFFPKDYVVLDIETTGFSTASEIIDLAAVRVRDNNIIDTFSSLVNPLTLIPSKITELTGITNSMVKDAPILDDVIDDFYKFLGDDFLIGHNIDSFDIRIISARLAELRCFKIRNKTIDTLELSREFLPLSHHKLSDVCNYFGVKNDNAHRALSDVIATHECYQHIKNGTIPDNPCFDETPTPRKHRPKFNNETKALQTLQGMLFGVTCDGILTEAEVMAVKKWLEDNACLSGNYPFDIAYTEIQKALEDGILEACELQSLLNTFIGLTNPVETCSCKCSSIEINGAKICLSGEFTHGSKSQIGELLISLGAEMSNSVTQKVNILLVGDIGSDAWACGNYGGKVKKAVELQDKGFAIKIISETDFYKELEVIKNG